MAIAKMALTVTTDDFCITIWASLVPRVLILVKRDERGRLWSTFKGGNWLKYTGNFRNISYIIFSCFLMLIVFSHFTINSMHLHGGSKVRIESAKTPIVGSLWNRLQYANCILVAAKLGRNVLLLKLKKVGHNFVAVSRVLYILQISRCFCT